ncbi:MAG: hypothetical protein II288_03990 [Alistipes sp.]|nr:hypothetical protein [Alistipes sp.]
MIIPNGSIKFRISATSGVDSQGYPTAIAEVWGDNIACQVLPNVILQSRSRGEAITEHRYTLLIDHMELPSKVVKLHYEGREVGQFSIRSYEHLGAVAQTRILL